MQYTKKNDNMQLHHNIIQLYTVNNYTFKSTNTVSSAPLPKRVTERQKMARVKRHDTQEAATINN